MVDCGHAQQYRGLAEHIPAPALLVAVDTGQFCTGGGFVIQPQYHTGTVSPGLRHILADVQG